MWGRLFKYSNKDSQKRAGWRTYSHGSAICYNADPAAFTSILPASNGSGAYSYSWENQLIMVPHGLTPEEAP